MRRKAESPDFKMSRRLIELFADNRSSNPPEFFSHFNLGLKLTLVSLACILAVTLFPYDVSRARIEYMLSLYVMRQVLFHWTNGMDVFLNFLLFIPTGIGCAAMLKESRRPDYLIPMLLGFALTGFIETAQFLLPGRFPSMADVLSNTAGCVAGAWLFNHRRAFIPPVLSRFLYSLRASTVLVAAGIYAALILASSLWLQSRMTLTNWNSSYHLLLGNEHHSERHWQGQIHNVTILDRAVSKAEASEILSGAKVLDAEALAHIEIASADSMPKTEGLLSEMICGGCAQGDSPHSMFGRHHWFISREPATELSQKICNSGQFTVVAEFQTNNVGQIGPARIISLSRNAWRRDFTIAQNKQKLVFRVRNGVTGLNGRFPDLWTSKLLRPGKWHRIVATYDGQRQALFVDNVNTSFYINYDLGAAFFSVFGNNELSEFRAYRMFYLCFLALPLGVLAATFASKTNWNWWRRMLIFSSAFGMFAIVLEFTLLVLGSYYKPSLMNILVSSLVFTVTHLFLCLDLSPFRKLLPPALS